jgi:3-keto-disaccharide hydrolase
MTPLTMNRRTFLGTAALVPAAVRALRAQSTGVEGNFVSLFDGQTLAGWSVQEGPASAFRVLDGAIVVDQGSNFPTWLRSDRQYENFDLRCEFFVKGWTNSGIYIHAPEHGRNTWVGMKINIFHQNDPEPRPESAGSIFPLIAPRAVSVRNEWNALRVLMDWPRLQAWMNDTLIQDIDVETVPELRHRLRRGYLGLESLSYPIRFRNMRIRELPAKETWEVLYDGPQDFGKWQISTGKPTFEPRGAILRGDGNGQLATRKTYRDFVLHLYIRGVQHHNGGVMFRSIPQTPAGRSHSYEIQLHDVEGAHYATGSLYSIKRAVYPRIEPEKWFLLQLVVQGSRCFVRINGENVLEYEGLQNLEAGRIELQAHDAGRWIEYKQIKIRRL